MKRMAWILAAAAVMALIGCGKEHLHHEEQAEVSHEDELAVSPAQMDQLGIALVGVREGQLARTLAVPASLQFDPARVVHISPKVAGTVLSVSVKPGDRVLAGQELLTLESRELSEAYSAYLQAASRAELEKAAFDRAHELWKQGLLSDQDHQEARSHQANAEIEQRQKAQALQSMGLDPEETAVQTLGVYRLRAPISGIVASLHAGKGESLVSEEEVVTVVDPSVVWVVGQAPELALGEAAVGQTVQVKLDALAEPRTATIEYLGLELDPNSRRFEIRASLENGDQRLKAGLMGTLYIELSSTDEPSGLLVPLSALQADGSGHMAFRQEEPGHFEPVAVTVLAKDGAWARVKSSLRVGDLLASGNTFVLKSEANLGEGAGHHSH